MLNTSADMKHVTYCIVLLLSSVVLANSRITLPVDSGAGSPNAGLQTLTMTNASVSSSSESGTSPTIVQYTQSADGQFYIPGITLHCLPFSIIL